MAETPKPKPQVPSPKPTPHKAAVPQYQGPMYESDYYETKSYAYGSVQFTKETVKQYVGTWVRCHSMYGTHEGMLHRALRDGIILVNHMQLTTGEAQSSDDVKFGLFKRGNTPDVDVEQVQFVLPFPGMFVPYGGLFAVYPRPFIW